MTKLECLSRAAPRWIEAHIDVETGIVSHCRVWLPGVRSGTWAEYHIPVSTIDELKQVQELAAKDPVAFYVALGWEPDVMSEDETPDLSHLPPSKKPLKDIGLGDL